MRITTWLIGLLAVVAGSVTTFLIAPLAVSSDLSAAYEALASSPNLPAAVGFGVVWALASIALTVLVGHYASRARGVAARIGICALVLGAILVGTILPAGAMSNAIADVPAGNWPAAEFPAWLLGWRIGAGAAVAAIGSLAIAGWRGSRRAAAHSAAV